MTVRPAFCWPWLQQVLLFAILVVVVQSLSQKSSSETSTTTATSSPQHYYQRRQESRRVGRQALLSLNLNLDALARDQQGEQAQALYQRIAALHQDGYYDVPPDTVSFNSVLKAYRNDPVRALEFWEAHAATPQKNIRSFNAFLLSLANAGLAKDAFTLWTQMQVVNAAVRPDVISWNTVLLAFANANDPESAEALLQTMMAKTIPDHPRSMGGVGAVANDGDTGIVPSTTKKSSSTTTTSRGAHSVPPFFNEISVATVMLAWSRHDDALLGAQKAEEWLYRHDQVLGTKPSPHAYAITLQAYSRCCSDAATTTTMVKNKVWEILQFMEQSDEAGATYNGVYHVAMSILANNGGGDKTTLAGMEAAKQVFQRMAQPDVPAYTRMIQLWGDHAKVLHNTKQRDTTKSNHCLMEILVLFRQMIKDPNVSPNSITYTTTLNAIAETQLSNSGDIAIALLHKIKNVSPIHYNAALKAVANSNHRGKVVQAAELLREMQTMTKTPPDHVAYHAILKAAQTGYGSTGARERNLHIGWDAFQALHELPDVPVSSITYQRCLRMIDTQDRKRKYTTTMAREVLEKCCTNGCLNRHVLKSARLLLGNNLANMLGVSSLPLDDSIDGLPEEWSRHAL
jgi:pentatricopeptide repeat protein